MFLQLFVLGPQFVRGELAKDNTREFPGAKPPKVGREKIHLRALQTIAPQRVVGNFIEMLGQLRVGELPKLFEVVVSKPARASEPVVMVNTFPVDIDAAPGQSLFPATL